MKHDRLFEQWTEQLEQWIATLPKPHPESDYTSSYLPIYQVESKPTHYYDRKKRRVRLIRYPDPLAPWVNLAIVVLLAAIMALYAWDWHVATRPATVEICQIGEIDCEILTVP